MNRSVLAFAPILALGLALGASLGGCPGSKGGPTLMAGTKVNSPEATAPVSPVISAEILAREPLANTATVKHILISWNDLADSFQGHIDQRAAKRSKADAEAEVRSLIQQLHTGADFDVLMKASSEDTGSAMSGRAFTVTPDAQLVIEFRQLSLRLKVDEIGVCQSDFGFHIIKRIS